MKKLAVAIVGVLLAAPALPAQHRVFSRPALPTQEDLDRLNLKMSWYTYLPVDGKRDGIFSVRVDTSQVLVLLRSAVVLALDPQTGATLWRARVGLPYVPPVGFGANSRSVFVAKGVNIYALDRTNGNPQWEFALPNAPAAAPVADEE
ncbi:MAG TPA: PQQ-binding-like beta-propeller repeat protein, partial [Gemmataceae bacterium]|nr:PQQ-binding-like beta-propeller repeat protein [Gemmataceae bacterium]